MIGAVLLLAGLIVAGCASGSGASGRANTIQHTLTSTVQIFIRQSEYVAGATDGEPAAVATRTVKIRRAGSGVVVHSQGAGGRSYLLTARHVVLPPAEQDIAVVAPNRSAQKIAKLVAVSEKYDLALLEVSGLELTPVTLKAQSTLGDGVWVVAFPWGRRRTVVTGVVSQVEWPRTAPDEIPINGAVLLIDAPVSYGTSGGGVFDEESGRLIGMVRGYRTAELVLPGVESGKIKLPVAGETTVVPSVRIIEFLERSGFGHLLGNGSRIGE